MYSDACSSTVRLNIGGKKFCTTFDTLTLREPQSMLAAMFSGRHTVCKDSEKGYVFVDRDGKHFRHILNWLRDGVAPNFSDFENIELLREAEYYQLLISRFFFSKRGLMDKINIVLKRKDDEEKQSELTRADIIKIIRSKNVRLSGINLSGLDLSKLDLSSVDFSFACLKNVIFSHSNLHRAKFQDVDAENANFHNATLRECEFLRANLRGALLAEANLDRANLHDHCVIGCCLCDADLRHANLWEAKVTYTNLEGANLRGTKLGRCDFKGANLEGACVDHDIRLVTFNLEGVKLNGERMTHVL
ncbi:FH protein interacting protein FIP2-like [Bidens hawaiensis]|uniref:FH protein interacting protein FIP2-like n=1 Tax=Bidens hawaiensis TaxID=980011 RepID=UPI0040492805